MYESIDSETIINNNNRTIRFKVYRTKPPRGEDFEMIIGQKGSEFFIKSYTWDYPEEEYDLTLFAANDEWLFFCCDENEEVYIHFF